MLSNMFCACSIRNKHRLYLLTQKCESDAAMCFNIRSTAPITAPTTANDTATTADNSFILSIATTELNNDSILIENTVFNKISGGIK